MAKILIVDDDTVVVRVLTEFLIGKGHEVASAGNPAQGMQVARKFGPELVLRTEMAMVKELAPDEPAYRSITRSWFQHSPLFEALKIIAENDVKLILTTDHGTIRVKRAFKIVGDRNTNTNLRYKQGKNLGYVDENVITAKKPEDFHLTKINVSTTYVFAVKDYFFAYPNNFNYYVKYYRDTFQHGGVSMEEIIIPIISLNSKNG